jgi:hypothetical protein
MPRSFRNKEYSSAWVAFQKIVAECVVVGLPHLSKSTKATNKDAMAKFEGKVRLTDTTRLSIPGQKSEIEKKYGVTSKETDASPLSWCVLRCTVRMQNFGQQTSNKDRYRSGINRIQTRTVIPRLR